MWLCLRGFTEQSFFLGQRHNGKNSAPHHPDEEHGNDTASLLPGANRNRGDVPRRQRRREQAVPLSLEILTRAHTRLLRNTAGREKCNRIAVLSLLGETPQSAVREERPKQAPLLLFELQVTQGSGESVWRRARDFLQTRPPRRRGLRLQCPRHQFPQINQ